jgi:hypothetical protein
VRLKQKMKILIQPEQTEPQPNFLECGGKRSATPLLFRGPVFQSGVAAALCHRSPKILLPWRAEADGRRREFNNHVNAIMKTLYTATASIEAGAGLALGCFPSAAVALLFGSTLDSPAAVALGRLTGVALLALGAACWLARGDAQSRAARGLIAAMVVYNLGAVALFTFAGMGLGLHGIALWPAIVLHAAMAIWCIGCLRCKLPANPIETSTSLEK